MDNLSPSASPGTLAPTADDLPLYGWAAQVFRVSGSIGIFTSACVVLTYLRFKTLRKKAFLLVFWMAFTDLAACLVPFLFGLHPKGHVCVAQAMYSQFFTISSILWCLVISLTLYGAVVLGGSKGNGERSPLLVSFTNNTCLVHCAVWGFAGVTTLAPLFTKSYGDVGIWCWIKGGDEGWGDTWRVACFYGPVWAVFFLLVTSYGMVFRALRRYKRLAGGRGPDDPQLEVVDRLMRYLWLYPAVFIVAWLPPSLFRAYELVNNSADENRWLFSIFSAFCAPAVQSFGNALAYGTTPSVKAQWKGVFSEAASALFDNSTGKGGDNDLVFPMMHSNNDNSSGKGSGEQNSVGLCSALKALCWGEGPSVHVSRESIAEKAGAETNFGPSSGRGRLPTAALMAGAGGYNADRHGSNDSALASLVGEGSTMSFYGVSQSITRPSRELSCAGSEASTYSAYRHLDRDVERYESREDLLAKSSFGEFWNSYASNGSSGVSLKTGYPNISSTTPEGRPVSALTSALTSSQQSQLKLYTALKGPDDSSE